MAESREFDIIIFGATGFTGLFVVEEVARTAKEEEGGLKWAVAGRSREKLTSTLEKASETLGEKIDVPIVEADVKNSESLLEMCRRTKVVLNCVGPYRFYGEPVVAACVASKTHHLDISGEPEFLERTQLTYNDEAKEAGIYVVGACGFDSIPIEIGINTLKEKFPGDINAVETYVSFKSGSKGVKTHYGTWHSAIYGFASSSQLKGLRRQLNQKLFKKDYPKSKYPLARRSVLFKSDVTNKWCLPFPGSDRTVSLRSERFRYEHFNRRPIQLQTYLCMSSLLASLVTMFVAIVFGVLASFQFGRSLLERYPELFSFGMFSREGPTREQLKECGFRTTFAAEGWTDKLGEPTDNHSGPPNKRMVLVLTAPDPGYTFTSSCLVQAGMVVLKESDKIPLSGGVLTPGAAFENTSLIQRLTKRGLELKIRE